MIVSDAHGKVRQSPLRGSRILVIEDEYFLAEDISAFLKGLGADIVGPTGDVEEAAGMVNSGQRIDAAVLDVNLRDRSIYPVAERLRVRNIPFVFTTGYDRNAIDFRFQEIKLFEKPIDIAAMAHSLGQGAALFADGLVRRRYAASRSGGKAVPGPPAASAGTAVSARLSHFSAWLSQVQLASGCSTACCRQIDPSAR